MIGAAALPPKSTWKTPPGQIDWEKNMFSHIALGSDECAPGLRLHYHPNYYGAYVRDPEGNKLQAVCHSAKGQAQKKPHD